MAVYNPPTRVTVVEIPFESLVRQVDPDFEKSRKRELAYTFSNNRRFFTDPTSNGAYADD